MQNRCAFAPEWLQQPATAHELVNMKRIGITSQKALGVSVANIRVLALQLGRISTKDRHSWCLSKWSHRRPKCASQPNCIAHDLSVMGDTSVASTKDRHSSGGKPWVHRAVALADSVFLPRRLAARLRPSGCSNLRRRMILRT
jgi:hypothetical protein